MSYDFFIEKICNHIIVDELVTLTPGDGTSFAFSRRPSSTSVKITIDGVVVPPSGLYSKAEVYFSKSEPYRIKYGVNDLILFKNGSGPVETIQIPAGNISAKRLADFLYTKLQGLDVQGVNGRVIVKSLTPTRGMSFSFPDPRWTDKSASLISTSRILGAYNLFGIPPGRCATGRKLFPGYKVYKNPDSFDGVEEFIGVFESPILNNNPVILVTYPTTSPFCGRCQGSRLEYDYTIAMSSYDTVKDADLLIQEANKFLFTVKGSHWKWPWLGSSLSSRIGQKADTAAGLASSFIGLDITNAFNVYKNIKSQQDTRFPNQNVSDAEFPLNLASLNVVSGDDPTTFYADYAIVSRSRTPLKVTRLISLPDPYQITTNPAQVLQRAARGYQLVG